MKKITISIVQMCSSNSLDYNERHLFDLLEQVPEGVKMIFTPENALYLSVPAHPPAGTKGPTRILHLSEPVFTRLQKFCKQRDCEILLGSVPVEDYTGVYNATCLVSGLFIRVVYKKMNLFDVDVDGETSVRESDVYDRGEETCVLGSNSWQYGLSICYDVRFAKLYASYARQRVDVICVPSAFLVRTGRAHWHTLLRARAIESQAFVIAAAQCGVHQSQTSSHTRRSFGHSLAVGPWGDILAEAGPDKAEVLNLELDKKQLEEVRRQMPMYRYF